MYNNRVSSDGKAQLDVDKRTGYGPETITLTNVDSGIYKFFTNNYSKDGPLNQSGAIANVYNGKRLIKEIRLDASSSNTDFWHIVDINVASGDVNLINQLVNDRN